MEKDIKGVIFDMDGVLLDTESICDKTWAIAAPIFSITVFDAMNAISSCRGRNLNDTLLYLKERFGEGFDAKGYINYAIKLFSEIEEKEGIAVMRGALDALIYIKDSGRRLFLASSTKGDTVKRQLKRAGLLDYFESLITGDTVVHSKPDPEIYCKVLDAATLSPAECVAIEDSPNGVKSAVAAGVKCIMVPDREKPSKDVANMAWRVIKSLEEIKSVL